MVVSYNTGLLFNSLLMVVQLRPSRRAKTTGFQGIGAHQGMTTTGTQPLMVVDDRDDAVFTSLGNPTGFRRVINRIDEFRTTQRRKGTCSRRSSRRSSNRTRCQGRADNLIPPPKPNSRSDSVANSAFNTGIFLSPQQVKGRVVENDQFSYETQPRHQLGGGFGDNRHPDSRPSTQLPKPWGYGSQSCWSNRSGFSNSCRQVAER